MRTKDEEDSAPYIVLVSPTAQVGSDSPSQFTGSCVHCPWSMARTVCCSGDHSLLTCVYTRLAHENVALASTTASPASLPCDPSSPSLLPLLLSCPHPALVCSQTELDECVRKSLNLLLTRAMSHCLAEVIADKKLQIQELVQLWVNLRHLKEASPHLEKYISRRTRYREERGGERVWVSD